MESGRTDAAAGSSRCRTPPARHRIERWKRRLVRVARALSPVITGIGATRAESPEGNTARGLARGAWYSATPAEEPLPNGSPWERRKALRSLVWSVFTTA
mgnify:CR=1 FL=1